jgi:YVTN family beta-propeller protein
MRIIKGAVLIVLSVVAITLSQAADAAQFAYVTNYFDNTVSVIDTSTNAVVATVPVIAYPSVVAVNPKGTFVYVGHSDPLLVGAGQLSVIDAATNTVVATVLNIGAVSQIAVNTSGTFVYVLNGTVTFGRYQVTVIDTSTNTVVATIPIDLGLGRQIALSRTRPRAYVAAGGSVLVIDTISNTVITNVSLGSSNGVQALAVDPSGTFIYAADSGLNNVSVIDTVTNSVVAVIPVGLGPNAVAVNPAGTAVYVTNQHDDSVSVINPATNVVVATVSLGNFLVSSPESIVVSPTGSFAYVVLLGQLASKTLLAIDTVTNTVVASLPVDVPYRTGIAVKPDGSSVYFVNSRTDMLSVVNSTTNMLIASVAVGRSPADVAVGPVVPAQPPSLAADSTLSLAGSTGNTFNVATNDPRLPIGATFSVTSSTCPTPIPTITAGGVVTYSAPATAGTSCTVTVQACAPIPDNTACSIETLTVTALATAMPVPTLSARVLIIMGLLLAALGVQRLRES